MTHHNCLNCGKKLAGNYCSGCGQKADTHRISFKHFIFHDVLHGTFHIEKGMLFTAKQALFRPGKAALDYIAGKRVQYYNVFYFILITVGLILFFRHFLNELAAGDAEELIQNRKYMNEASKKIDIIFSQKSKLIIFLFVPLAALNSFMLFRRKKLNLSEHFIIAGMILLGMLLISLLGNLFFYIDLMIPFSSVFADTMSIIITALIFLHVGYGYINAFGANYSKLGVMYRIVLFFALFCLEILIMLIILIGIATHWKFGEVTISPFS